MTVSRRSHLIQERADLVKANEALLAIVGDANATEPEREKAMTEAEANIDRIAALGKEIDLYTAQEAARLATSAPLGADHAAATGRLGAFVHDRASDMPWGYEMGVRLIQKPDGTQGYGGVANAEAVAVGSFLQAVARAGTPGNIQVDPRLFRADASGASTGVPSDGGFLVGTDMSMMLMNRGVESAVLAPRCMSVEISANSDGIEAPYIDETSRANGSRWGGVRVYRRAEADTVTATKPTLAMFELRLADIMGIAYTTDRALQDASALGQIFTNAFTSEFAFKLDDEIIRGSGVGECQGILNAAALVTVSKETGQAADTVLAENIINMRARMVGRSRPRAVWLINAGVEPQLQQMTLALGATNALVYMPPGGLSQAPYGTLYGSPVIVIEQAEELGTVGDILYVDLNEYLLIRKGGIQADQSMHVRFLYGEQTFRWLARVNGKPVWRSALTPYQENSNVTYSPFVALASRA